MKSIEFEDPLTFKECGITTFGKIMKKMNFKKKKTKDLTRNILMEKPQNVIKRREYLRTKRNIEKTYPGIKFVFVDETWVHRNYLPKLLLVSGDEFTKKSLQLSKGNQLFI